MKLKHLFSVVIFPLALNLHAHEGEKGHAHDEAPKPVIEEKVITGNGAFTYIADPKFGSIDGNAIGSTHGGVAIDSAGHIYVSTDGPHSIIVFKPDGTFVKKIAPDAQGSHHLCLIKEGDKEFIYAANLAKNRVLKLDLDGNIIMEISEQKSAPIPGGYGGLTGVAVAPNGAIYFSNGYGSGLIHEFDAAGKYVKSFGGNGAELEKFHCPHTIAIDTRFGEPRILVCDREKRRLVHYGLDGKFIGVYATHLRRPCAVSLWGDYCAVAELESRAVVLDKNGTPISFLGDNPDRAKWANFHVAPDQQKLGLFSAPHGLSFDTEGNLYIQDWNATGRVTQLKLVK